MNVLVAEGLETALPLRTSVNGLWWLRHSKPPTKKYHKKKPD